MKTQSEVEKVFVPWCDIPTSQAICGCLHLSQKHIMTCRWWWKGEITINITRGTKKTKLKKYIIFFLWYITINVNKAHQWGSIFIIVSCIHLSSVISGISLLFSFLGCLTVFPEGLVIIWFFHIFLFFSVGFGVTRSSFDFLLFGLTFLRCTMRWRAAQLPESSSDLRCPFLKPAFCTLVSRAFLKRITSNMYVFLWISRQWFRLLFLSCYNDISSLNKVAHLFYLVKHKLEHLLGVLLSHSLVHWIQVPANVHKATAVSVDKQG